LGLGTVERLERKNFNIFYSSFPSHAASDLKWLITQLGIFYAILSGIMLFIQGPVLSRALRKFSEEKLVIIGSVILCTNFILLIVSNIYWVYTTVILFAIGNGLIAILLYVYFIKACRLSSSRGSAVYCRQLWRIGKYYRTNSGRIFVHINWTNYFSD